MQIAPKLATIGAISALSLSLLGSPASASTCLPGAFGTDYTFATSCTLGPLTFSNFSLAATLNGVATTLSFNLTPIDTGSEFGFLLGYGANVSNPGDTIDVQWNYVISAASAIINDAQLSLSTFLVGDGQANVIEQLFNGQFQNFATLTLNGAGSTGKTFDPVSFILATKDQATGVPVHASDGSRADTSFLGNTFSVVPLPGALPLFAGGLGLLGYLGRRRRKVMTEALA